MAVLDPRPDGPKLHTDKKHTQPAPARKGGRGCVSVPDRASSSFIARCRSRQTVMKSRRRSQRCAANHAHVSILLRRRLRQRARRRNENTVSSSVQRDKKVTDRHEQTRSLHLFLSATPNATSPPNPIHLSTYISPDSRRGSPLQAPSPPRQQNGVIASCSESVSAAGSSHEAPLSRGTPLSATKQNASVLPANRSKPQHTHTRERPEIGGSKGERKPERAKLRRCRTEQKRSFPWRIGLILVDLSSHR